MGMANTAYLLEQGHCLNLTKLDCEKAALRYYKLLNEQYPKGEYSVKVCVQTLHILSIYSHTLWHTVLHCIHTSVYILLHYLKVAVVNVGCVHCVCVSEHIPLENQSLVVACVGSISRSFSSTHMLFVSTCGAHIIRLETTTMRVAQGCLKTLS
jgi:hypothetical protein